MRMLQGNADLKSAAPHPSSAVAEAIKLRAPLPADGSRVWALIEATPALDSNSLYANLLQCSDFSDTCALAERAGEVVGWMSGYIPPAKPDTLFVWQICVSDAARGQGAGKRLIEDVLARRRTITQGAAAKGRALLEGRAFRWSPCKRVCRHHRTVPQGSTGPPGRRLTRLTHRLTALRLRRRAL